MSEQPYGPMSVPPQQQPYGDPYAQQQPYVWGVPPAAPPPKRRRVGLVLGVVGGVVVATAMVGLAVRGIQEASGAAYPKAEYTLTVPKKLVGGRYELDEDASGSAEAREIEKGADSAWGSKDLKAVIGQYSSKGDGSEGTLVVSGLYGRFKYPGLMREGLMSGAAGEGYRVVVAAKDFHPAGADGITITCEVATKKQADMRVTIPICAWAEGNTGGVLSEIITAKASQDPAEADLSALATLTAQVRSEMRKPIR